MHIHIHAHIHTHTHTYAHAHAHAHARAHKHTRGHTQTSISTCLLDAYTSDHAWDVTYRLGWGWYGRHDAMPGN